MDFPNTDNPNTENPNTENPTQLNKEQSITEKQNTDIPITDSIPFRSVSQPDEPSPPAQKEPKRTETREISAYRELVKSNIEYASLRDKYPAAQLDEIVDLLTETVSGSRPSIRVAGENYPAEFVRAKLLKLTGEHVEFVLDCMRENTTKVRNIKQYLLASLFNAPSTMDSYYASRVNHDLYGGG